MLQDRDGMNLSAGRGVIVRSFPLTTGEADYLLFVDAQPVGVLEAKPEGHTLTGVEPQAQKYSEGLPNHLSAPVRPLPFQYISTGTETRFTNLLDPHARSRRIFQFHRPETCAEWLPAAPVSQWASAWIAAEDAPTGGLYGDKPASLRGRLRAMPPVSFPDLWDNKIVAITNLERSLRDGHRRALIQMATGSGKTKLAIAAIYRLIKYANARRVLFLVDRTNLGEQAEKEFANFLTPEEKRKFPELYNVQRLTSNNIGSSSKVVITTIQRLYSMLKGEPDLDPDAEEGSQFDASGGPAGEPYRLEVGEAIVMPANQPHALNARGRFKMLLTMLRE